MIVRLGSLKSSKYSPNSGGGGNCYDSSGSITKEIDTRCL